MSLETISSITDSVISYAKEWQQRPLEDIYPIISIDAMGNIDTKGTGSEKATVYGSIGIDLEGKDVVSEHKASVIKLLYLGIQNLEKK